MNQKTLFLTVSLIALLAISGIFWSMQKRQMASNKPVTIDPVAETPVQKQEQIKQLSQARCDVVKNDSEAQKNWKVYSNESPKFSFRYPETWSKNFPERNDGEISIALYDPKMSCSVEGSSALCGVSVSLYPIVSEASVNVKYLQRMREVEQVGQAEIKKICVAGKEAIEITDYLRHEIIFDREGYSFIVTANNLGSENQNKKFWSVVDSIGSDLRFE